MEWKEPTAEEIIKDAAKEDNNMIVRRFVAMVGHDYYSHYKRKEEEHIAQIHPDFSENTRLFWREIEARLNEPTVLYFNKVKCIDLLTKEAMDQSELCKRADYTSSYHYGLKQAYWDTIKIINDCINPRPVITDEGEEYCKNCRHVEMCSWYGTVGCEWRDEG